MSDHPVLVWGLVSLALLVLSALVWVARRRRRQSPPELPSAEQPPSTEPFIVEAAEPEPSPAAPLVVLRRPTPTRYPLVLAHGYFGFDSIGVPRLRQEYFRGVRKRLEALGHIVHAVRVS